jgi:WD40 repeat protein
MLLRLILLVFMTAAMLASTTILDRSSSRSKSPFGHGSSVHAGYHHMIAVDQQRIDASDEVETSVASRSSTGFSSEGYSSLSDDVGELNSPLETVREWQDGGYRIHKADWPDKLLIHATFDHAGGRLLTVGVGGGLRVWDVSKGIQLIFISCACESAQFSRDGAFVVTDFGEVWDWKSGKVLVLRDRTKGASTTSATFMPNDNDVLISSSGGSVVIWDFKNGKKSRDFRGHSGSINSAEASVDGSQIVTASDDHTVRIWNVDTGMLRLTLESRGAVDQAIFSADGLSILTASEDHNKFVVWNAMSGARRAALSDSDGMPKGWPSPIENRLARATGGGNILTWSGAGFACSNGLDFEVRIRVWSSTTFRLLASTPHEAHKKRICSVALSRDGKMFATASADGLAKIWNTNDASQLLVLRGHLDKVTSVSFSEDSYSVVTASVDGTARVWDINTGEQKMVLGNSLAK